MPHTVVRPGFDLTSSDFVRSRASQSVETNGRLESESGPTSGGRDLLTPFVQKCASVQTSAGGVIWPEAMSPDLSQLAREAKLVGMKFIGRCPCQVSV